MERLRALVYGTVLLISIGWVLHVGQAIFVPADGIDTEDGRKSYDEVCADLAKAVTGFLSKPEVAHAVLGAVQSADTLKRIEQAGSGALGKVVLASTALEKFSSSREQTAAVS